QGGFSEPPQSETRCRGQRDQAKHKLWELRRPWVMEPAAARKAMQPRLPIAGCRRRCRRRISYFDLGAELLRNNSANNLEKIVARFFEHERVLCIRPAELEGSRKRGNPNFAYRRVWRNDELHFLRLLENHFELSTLAFDVEAVFVGNDEQPFL